MGLLVYDALVLSKVVEFIDNPGRCLTLGVPTLTFKPDDFLRIRAARPEDFAKAPSNASFEDAPGFFRDLGFETVDALDISGYEGANIVDDLNLPDLPSRVAGDYDLIYDSGTIEHIFDAPTALRSLVKLLRPGGIIVHATPTNGFMDHGLWQISPDLYRLFYTASGFEILTSSLFVFGEHPYALPADINLYRTHGRKHIVDMAPEAIAVFAARKGSDSNLTAIAMQDYYAAMHGAEQTSKKSQFFLKYGVRPGEAKDDMPPTSRPARHIPFSRSAGVLKRKICRLLSTNGRQSS